ncbi:hypothetical protein Cpin_2592 [Sporocytophaga myxococcoides]|uniref:DUF2157 domain-containing protein n=1 Tax=Sporocytophaga myxococcoides TaxID=153721 RepID=A0A098LFV9_9BACT|nr:hypothetical protein [Sporocytophaga myxococcoides]GAL85322.1 hypothetical protein Cpin_2592 [Sporocytophaga myxococcoides]
MIIYNKKSLKNLRLLEQAKIWKEKQLFSEHTFEKIKGTYINDLYTPNFFIRTGLFLFTSILISASLGLITLITFSDSTSDFGLLRTLIYAILTGFTSEMAIKEKKFFRAGVDDALQYATVGLFISSIAIFIDILNRAGESYYNESDNLIQVLTISLPVLIFFAIHYVDRLITVLAFGVLIYLIFYLVSNTGNIGKAICPFVIGLTTFFIYLLIKKYAKVEKWIIWKDNFNVLEFLCLLILYLSVNYFVVRELNALLNDDYTSKQIPLAWLFYITTATIPLLYIYSGVTHKDRLQLQLGILLIAFAVFTFKYYFSLGHHEITITLAGVIMIGIAWFVTKLLKTPKIGLTINKEDLEIKFNLSDAEALVIAETMGKDSAQQDSFEFGEGNFGGGGSGGKF